MVEYDTRKFGDPPSDEWYLFEAFTALDAARLCVAHWDMAMETYPVCCGQETVDVWVERADGGNRLVFHVSGERRPHYFVTEKH